MVESCDGRLCWKVHDTAVWYGEIVVVYYGCGRKVDCGEG